MRSNSLCDSFVASTQIPPLAPPYGSFKHAHLNVIHNARASQWSRSTDKWYRIPPL